MTEEGVASYFDGNSSRKHAVTLRFGNALEILEENTPLGIWAYGDIRRAEGPPDQFRLMCISAPPLARIEIQDDATKELLSAHCRALDLEAGNSSPAARIVLWSLAAACSIVALLVYGIPLAADRLAFVIPPAAEKRLGEAVDQQVHIILGKETCTEDAGQAALTALVDQLAQAGALETPLRVEALATKLPNAFALPGGKVYVTKGLLEKARGPDELAGVIAHELGHIQHRDSLRQLIQNGGTAFMVGLLFGDVLGGGALIVATRSLLDNAYSRDAERGADAFAVEVMHKLGRSPQPFGELLSRITGPEFGNSFTLLSSHPLTEERLATMKRENRTSTGPELLSAKQWTALKNICRGVR